MTLKSGSILIRKILKINIKANWFNSRIGFGKPFVQGRLPITLESRLATKNYVNEMEEQGAGGAY